MKKDSAPVKLRIPFNRPFTTGNECRYIQQALAAGHISGNGPFTKKCEAWFRQRFSCRATLLTQSCTAALEMAALLAGIGPGDEVIMPSYTFVSTANAFVLRGARIVFVDIRPDTMNIDERLISSAITRRTRALVPVHYAGVACAMEKIMALAKAHGLVVIEDAAQAVMATYRSRHLGTIGALGCYSFHETKNYTCGEGGALVINDQKYFERAEIIREKGTDRAKFYRGQVDKYTWVGLGSSYLPGELSAAFLWAQLTQARFIYQRRMRLWQQYERQLRPLADAGLIELPVIPPECRHSGHMFYIKVKDIAERADLIRHLAGQGILSVFHYVPLHSSPAGKKYGRFSGKDRWTTRESQRLLRLPLYCDLRSEQVERIVHLIKGFYGFGSTL